MGTLERDLIQDRLLRARRELSFLDVTGQLGTPAHKVKLRELEQIQQDLADCGEPLQSVNISYQTPNGPDNMRTVNNTLTALDLDGYDPAALVRRDLLPGILTEGGQTIIYGPTSRGKSLLALEAATALATGVSFFGSGASPPRSVLYLDQEMSPSDIYLRLASLGYQWSDVKSKLTLLQRQRIPPFDTREGATVFLGLVDMVMPSFVVVDTLIHFVAGDEQDSDTYKRVFDLVGSPLKDLGISILFLDHTGKDESKGPRGSSAKQDYMDLGWRLQSPLDHSKVELTCTKSRIDGIRIGSKVTFDVGSNPLCHVIAKEPIKPVEITPEIQESIDLLNEQDISPKESARTAAKKIGRRYQVVLEAQKARRQA